MNNQFKPGDLALVISGGKLGETAELVRFVLPGDVVISHTTGKEYEFRPAAGIGGWLCIFRDCQAVKHEKNLMPLRGEREQERSRQMACQ